MLRKKKDSEDNYIWLPIQTILSRSIFNCTDLKVLLSKLPYSWCQPNGQYGDVSCADAQLSVHPTHGLHDVVVVGERFSHTHHYHIGKAAVLSLELRGKLLRLFENLCRSQLSGEVHLTSCAENAVSDVRYQICRTPVLIVHKYD